MELLRDERVRDEELIYFMASILLANALSIVEVGDENQYWHRDRREMQQLLHTILADALTNPNLRRP